MSRTAILILSCLLFAVSPVVAKEKATMSGKAPYASAWHGLLPDDMQLMPAADFHPSQLRGARVALVPSANFNEWARVWATWFDEEGDKYNRSSWGFGGGRGETHRGYEYSSSPLNFSERVALALQPYAGEIFIAEDLVQARDAGADFYLVLDGWLGTFSRWNTYLHATGGVYLLDGNLHSAFSAHGEAKAKYQPPSLLESFSKQALGEAMEISSRSAMDEMIRQVIEDMQGHLGSHY